MNPLEVRGLSFAIAGVPLLRDLSFNLEPGKAYALIGPNGAGKSTLLKFMGGLRGGFTGDITLGGAPIAGLSPRARSRWVTYVPQSTQVAFPITVMESVALGRIAHTNVLGELSREGRDEARALLASWGMESFAGRDLRSLSEGEKQKVSLIRAVFQGAQVLLLDETLSSLDVDHQLEAVERLRLLLGQDKTLVLVTHDINLATEWGDRFLVLRKGHLIAAGGEEIFVDMEMIRQLYPVARIERIEGVAGRIKFIFHREPKLN